MSTGATVKIEGLAQLNAAFAELPASLHRGVLLPALRRAAVRMERDANIRAPRGRDPARRGSAKQRRSGQSLRIGAGAASIKARPVRGDKTQPTSAAVAIGPDAAHWYLRFAEFGTSRQAATPFLRPAFDANVDGAIQVFVQEAAKSVNRTARRLARQAAQGKLAASSRRALST